MGGCQLIVLDTHVLIWWVSGIETLSPKAANIIAKHQLIERSILISSITAWEISMLVERGRLTLNMEVQAWLEQVGRIPAVEFVPLDNTIAVKSACLPGEFHKDPADRILVALARQGSHSLVTADKKIRGYTHVKSVW